ncbi:UNVERIFIED_CONTAM: hypothetical protein K2H54_029905 [Gekko kuhli]
MPVPTAVSTGFASDTERQPISIFVPPFPFFACVSVVPDSTIFCLPEKFPSCTNTGWGYKTAEPCNLAPRVLLYSFCVKAFVFQVFLHWASFFQSIFTQLSTKPSPFLHLAAWSSGAVCKTVCLCLHMCVKLYLIPKFAVLILLPK